MGLDIELRVNEEAVFEANITHNLSRMAQEAGFRNHLWGYIEIERAKDLINPLARGYENFIKNPEYYRQFDSANGWGTLKQFLPWIDKLLSACKMYPDSFVYVFR